MNDLQPWLYKTVALTVPYKTTKKTWPAGSEFFVGVQDGKRLALYKDHVLIIATASVDHVKEVK